MRFHICGEILLVRDVATLLEFYETLIDSIVVSSDGGTVQLLAEAVGIKLKLHYARRKR